MTAKSNNNVNESNSLGVVSGECQSWGKMSEKYLNVSMQKKSQIEMAFETASKGQIFYNNIPFESDLLWAHGDSWKV